MARLDDRRRVAARRTLFAAGLFAFGPVMAAQGQDVGGIVYTFGIDQRLASETNPGLDVLPGSAEHSSRTRLSFGFVTETRTQRLAFSAEGTLAASNAADNGFILPKAELDYRIESASTALGLTAFFSESEVDSTEFVTDTDGATPIVTSVVGTGTQQRLGATARIEFGRDAPFGGDFSIGLTDTEYTGTTDPDLVDNRRITAGLSLRFALTEVTTATARLSASRLEELGVATSKSESLSLGLEHALPNGAFTMDATFAQLETGERRSLSFGRSFDLPAGRISASLGLSEVASGGGSRAIASLDWQKDLPRGAFTFALNRSVTGNARDSETEVSSLSLGLTQELAPRLGLTVSVGLQDSVETLTNASTQSATVGTSLRYALTEDWGMNVGASHRFRDEDGVGRARSNKVFLSINRTFEFRP